MDRLRERLTVAGRALATLRELAQLGDPPTVERGAAIKRFEYSVETTWKAAQQFLRVVEGIDVGSPKAAVRAAREAGLLSEAEAAQALMATDDRNLAAHTYNEELAKMLFARLSGHLEVLEVWLDAMGKRLPPRQA